MTKNDNRTDVLFEDISGKFDFILEILAPIKKQTDKIPRIEQDIEEIKADIKIIKLAAKRTNENFANHERKHGWFKANLA